MSLAHPSVGGDGQADHQPCSRQHRRDPKPYSPGHRDLLHSVRPAIWDQLEFEAAATADGYRMQPALLNQKIQVGLVHAGKIVTVTAEDHSFRLAIDGQAVGVVPRTTAREIHRYKAYAARPREGRR